jgi:hypothetical protein
MRPARLNKIARELVVPWSIARIYESAICPSVIFSSHRSVKSQRLLETGLEKNARTSRASKEFNED